MSPQHYTGSLGFICCLLHICNESTDRLRGSLSLVGNTECVIPWRCWGLGPNDATSIHSDMTARADGVSLSAICLF